jgi:MFS family permease
MATVQEDQKETSTFSRLSVTEEQHEYKHEVDEDHIGNDRAFKGDDSDGKVDWTLRTAIVALTLGMLYTGSQIVLYMVGGMDSYVSAALGAQGKAGWITVANTLAITSVAPFTGYLQDLVGRREITLIGSAIICVGIALVGSAHSFGQAVGGMAMAGAGAGICELSALAGLSDIVPVKHRGYALALMIACILPFTPYVIYGQLLASHTSWRWGIWLCLFYNVIVLIGLAVTYFPKGHPRMEGMTRKKILLRIDYVGALLSLVGLTIFLVALQAGGTYYPWTSAYVLTQLIVGMALIAAWVVWEWKFARYPMIPHQIFQGQNVVALVFFIAFVAGLNFYSLLNFYPLSFATVFNPDPIQIGLKGLGYGISITVGAVFFNGLISTGIEAKWILLVAATLMSK